MEFGQDHHHRLSRASRQMSAELIWEKPIGHHTFPWGFVVIFHKLQPPQIPGIYLVLRQELLLKKLQFPES